MYTTMKVQPIQKTVNRTHNTNTLTEAQKQHNKQEAASKIFQLVLERVLQDRGVDNARV